MRKFILVATLLVAILNIHATSSLNRPQQVSNYISTYLNLASIESARSGIPVSIILAQGILESQCGESKLARTANNHFGIKWKSTADGSYVMRYDDDKDKHGNKVASRFVKYDSAEESYRHHTEFLMNRERYSNLFQLSRADYRGWAQGLSTCKYATDPQYATKLIQKIETYHLYEFDIPEVLTLEDEAENDVQVVDYNAPAQRRAMPTPQTKRYSDVTEISNNNVENDSNSESELFEITSWESKNPSPSKSGNKLYEISSEPVQTKTVIKKLTITNNKTYKPSKNRTKKNN